MSWSGRQTLVTGAGGFIGSHLVERLVELGAQTRALVEYNSDGSWGWLDRSSVKDDVEVTLGDVCDGDSMRQLFRGVDTVFHLAALIAIPYSYVSPMSFVRTNVEGTLNVLQGAREAGVRMVIHTSTSEVYGTARYVPMDEEHPLQGQSPYAASKIGADKMVEAFHLSYSLPVTTLRPFNTYGPRQSARAVIPTIISQAIAGSEVRLGNLTPTRDLVYVEDTVEGFVRIADCERAIGSVVNLGTGEEVSVGDLARRLLELLGKDIPVVQEARRERPDASEVDRLCADNSRALELLGWSPRHSLEQGLKKTVEWIERNVERYRPGVYSY